MSYRLVHPAIIVGKSVRPELPVYDVHAVISPDGVAERVNTITHKTFRTIDSVFFNHAKERFLILNVHGSKVIHVVDLWQTIQMSAFPYIAPCILEIIVQGKLEKLTFDTVDHAIGYVALHLC